VLIQSVASAVAGTRLRWQKIPRTGRFSAAPLGTMAPKIDRSGAEPQSAAAAAGGTP
jgi:hypothetical protein